MKNRLSRINLQTFSHAMLGSMPCRKSQIGAEFHFLLIVKTADAIMFSDHDHAIMHDSFSIVAAITAILIPNLLLQVYAYLKSSVVASRCLISSDHVLSTEIWKLFSSLEHKVMKKTKPS